MGILESIRKSRAKTKAEIKAATARAKKEAKEAAKLEYRRDKLLAKQEKNLLKAEKKSLKAKRKHERSLAENLLEQKRAGSLNKDKVMRWTGALRVILPLALPLVYRALTSVRDQATQTRAQQLGVDAEKLSRFAGPAAEVKARIQSVRENLKDSSLATGFKKDAEERLDELKEAADNAELMVPEQRRRALAGINRDLDDLTGQINERLLKG